MVLRYMVSDTDLAKGQTLQPKHRVVESEAPVVESNGQVGQAKKGVSLPKKRRQFWLLLVACVVVWTLVYDLWAGEKSSRFWAFLMTDISTTNIFTTDGRVVTGIMYYAEDPSAIVYNEVVHEGDTIKGYKVVKISRQEVVLEKNGRTFTKQVR